MFENGGGRSVEADVLRPVLSVAREPRSTARSAWRSRPKVPPLDRGPASTGRARGRRPVPDRGATEGRDRIQDPRDPLTKTRGQVVARNGLGGRRRRAGDESGGEISERTTDGTRRRRTDTSLGRGSRPVADRVKETPIPACYTPRSPIAHPAGCSRRETTRPAVHDRGDEGDRRGRPPARPQGGRARTRGRGRALGLGSGCRLIEHGHLMDDVAIATLKENGTYLVPTVFLGEYMEQ